MSFADEMMNLGEKLVTSSNNRINDTRTILRNTRKMINKFHLDNKTMARELRDNLNEFRENLESNTGKMMRTFRNEHKEMAKKQGDKLEEFTNNLTHNTNGYMRKCRKNRMDMHDMFEQAHKNFMRCMHEIERKKKHPSSSFEPEIPTKQKRHKKRTRH